MKKAFVNLSTARFRGNSHEAKKKKYFLLCGGARVVLCVCGNPLSTGCGSGES
jgi:hypothetical protein